MTHKTQKIITTGFIAFASFFGFEALVYILNLNQSKIFFATAFWISVYLILMMFLLFDLHFRTTLGLSEQHKQGKFQGTLKISTKKLYLALVERFEYLLSWKHFSIYLHYAILPGLIFWSTVAIFYFNLGQDRIQQMFILLSSLALTANFWFLKESFYRKSQVVEKDIFIPMATLKIYGSLVVYAAINVFVRRYCLDTYIFQSLIFLSTFALIYQALFQHRATNLKNLLITVFISVVMSVFGWYVLSVWGYNYFTGAAFLTVLYNLCWGIFHYYIDKKITLAALIEILIISGIIASLIFSVTNFKARITGDCQYKGFFKQPTVENNYKE